jgi:PA14 domain-containing protein
MTSRDLYRLVGASLAGLVLLVSGAAGETINGLKPAEPQPTQLTPGLAVEYSYGMVNNLDQLKGRKYEPGPPIESINYRWSGNVLTSKVREGVAANIDGFIRFEKAGVYGFEVTSNDGVRVEIGGKLLHVDPEIHADSTSDRIEVKIDTPGWYPLKIVYFQKKGTASLVLAWVGPGEKGKAVPVPAKAYGYVKK